MTGSWISSRKGSALLCGLLPLSNALDARIMIGHRKNHCCQLLLESPSELDGLAGLWGGSRNTPPLQRRIDKYGEMRPWGNTS